MDGLQDFFHSEAGEDHLCQLVDETGGREDVNGAYLGAGEGEAEEKAAGTTDISK